MLTAVALGVGAAPTLASLGAIETVAGAQHPDNHIHGFVLRSAYVHRGRGRLLRRTMRFDDHPHLLQWVPADDDESTQRRHILSLPEFTADENSKERVIALAKVRRQPCCKLAMEPDRCCVRERSSRLCRGPCLGVVKFMSCPDCLSSTCTYSSTF